MPLVLRTAHRTLSHDFESIVIENEKINEKNNELILKLSTMEKGPGTMPDMPEIEESEDDPEPENEKNEEKKPISKKTSIDRYLQMNKNSYENIRHRFSKTENLIKAEIKEMTQEDLNSKPQIKIIGEPIVKRHERGGSLFTEIIALKKNEIIDDGVFEEGFEKINRLNTEMKGFGPQISELDISTNENTLQKPILIENCMIDPEKKMRNLFKSKQIIQIAGEERKERRKTNEGPIEETIGNIGKKEKNENPYEEFFILVILIDIFFVQFNRIGVLFVKRLDNVRN